MIEVKDLTVARGGRPVLEGVSFQVPEQGFLSILGPSGTGKTTLLSAMAGLLPQDGGEVLVDGVSVDGLPAHRRAMAVVFQDSRLFPSMNVRANVAFPLKMKGVGRREREAAADVLLAKVRLEGMGDRRPGQLSGGQRQRVALARALAADPAVVLLDEPFSGLDESLRGEMRALVLELQAERAIPMVMVTHDALEALTMSDEVVYLEGGSVAAAGTPREVLLDPDSAAVGCFPGLTALEGKVERGVFRAGRLTLEAPSVGDGPAVLLRRRDGRTEITALEGGE